ncbi:MAG: magnesium transporter [Rhodobacteraceae bacterium]|nr:magnesium transporter [Paracoccaceae bacterium]
MIDPALSEAEDPDHAYEINTLTVSAVLEAVESGSQTRLTELLDRQHAADVADLLEQISSKDRRALLALWGDKIDGEVLSEVDEGLRAEMFEHLPDAVVTEAVRELETDDVVDLVEDMDAPQQERLMDALEDADRVAVEQSLQYPEETAGRLMQRELVMSPPDWSVGDAIDHLRGEEDLPEHFYKVMIVNPFLQPVGTVALGSLLTSARDTRLADIMDEDFRVIPALQSQEDVAYAFNQYHMVSAPVVDDEGRLVGVITIDDAMDVLDEEAEEDIMLLAGVLDESLSSSVIATSKLRFPWLAVNLATSVLASIVIAQFASTIEAIVALAVLMPIVASMGGNAGTQTLTVAVRALATKDLTPANAWRVIRREVAVGFFNGCVFALIIGAIGIIWYGSPMLGVVLGLSMIANLLVAGLAGILIPLGLDKVGVDPALASGAFVTTVTDMIGFFSFLGLAAMILL